MPWRMNSRLIVLIALSCPSQIGTIKFTVAWTIAELGHDGFDEGDVVLHNDPYRGSGHVPEHMLLKPVFHEGNLVAFVTNFEDDTVSILPTSTNAVATTVPVGRGPWAAALDRLAA